MRSHHFSALNDETIRLTANGELCNELIRLTTPEHTYGSVHHEKWELLPPYLTQGDVRHKATGEGFYPVPRDEPELNQASRSHCLFGKNKRLSRVFPCLYYRHFWTR